MKLLLGFIAAIAMLAVLSGCGSDTKVSKVTIDEAEWSIKVDPASVVKGPVEFTINNNGDKDHNVLILQTNIAPDKLPTKSDGSVDTGAPDIKLVHTIDEIDGGDKTGRTFDMDPGTYVLISNLVDDNNGTKTAQYGQGMYTSFTVTADTSSPSASAAAGSPSPTPTVGLSGAGSVTPTTSP